MKIYCEATSIIGKIRGKNQDNFYLNGLFEKITDNETFLQDIFEEDNQLFAVCDGMGGEAAGEVASLMAIESLNDFYHKGFEKRWSDYIKAANKKICEYQTEHHIRMGTTFAGLCITPSRAVAVNVGDSRIYRIREGSIFQISKDHNEYQIMMEAGGKPDDRTARKAKSRLTQCLGIEENTCQLEPHTEYITSIKAGDIFLICSDGLYEGLSDQQINQIVHSNQSRSITKSLVYSAELNGSRDNITALVVYVSENDKALSNINKIVEKIKNILKM